MKSKAFRTIVGSLCVLPFALPVHAQAPASASPAQPPPAVRVTARLVEVNVIVHGKKGQPVGDLTRDDFALLDQGQPQTISRFEVVKNEAPTAPPLRLAMFPQTYQQAQREGMKFTKELEIYPGATRLRIIVRDGASSALGSVTIPLAGLSTKNAG